MIVKDGNTCRSWHRPESRAVAIDTQYYLSPHDLLYSLFNLSSELVTTWVQILHCQAPLKPFFGSDMHTEADQISLYAIVAMTPRIINDPGLNIEA